MRKILLGISVLISLAFLASCGGGSSGSSGAAGADGAAGTAGTDGTNGTDGTAGTDGTIAVPSADGLTITKTSTTDDTDVTLTSITAFDIKIVGMDNRTVDSRERLYVYEGLADKGKSAPWDTGFASITGLRLTTGTDSLDPRLKTADNITLTVTRNTATVHGTDYLTICAGNEAGDATVCDSVLVNNRGIGNELETSDNDTVFFAFVNSSTVNVGGLGTPDNTTSVRALTESKAGTPSFGTATDTAVAYTTTEFIGGAAVGDSNYVLHTTGSDNWTITTLGGSAIATGIFDNTTVNGSSVDAADIASDGTSLFAVAVTGSQVYADNATFVLKKIAVGGTKTTLGVSGSNGFKLTAGGGTRNPVCLAASDRGVVIGTTDNVSGVVFAGLESDNTTGPFTIANFGANVDNYTATTTSGCDMTYASNLDSGDNRTFYMAYDNVTVLNVFKLIDNSSNAGAGAITIGTPITQALGATAQGIHIGVNSDDAAVVLVDNGSNAMLYRMDNSTATSLTLLYDYTSLSSGSGVALGVNGKKYTIVTGKAAKTNVRVFYDE
jgi:hypothetical protein